MRVGILGATGFIGGHITQRLAARGDEIVNASLRDPEDAARRLASCDAVVNLAGETLAQRWNATVKHDILYTRTQLPQRFLETLATFCPCPGIYVSASAIGYYGTSETATFTESSPPGNDFLARVCVAWEREAQRAQAIGMRVSLIRTGVVLGNGGALGQMLPPFKLGAGGVIGGGRQWISWVHVEDVAGIYLQALDGAAGPLNATAPNPVTNAEFTRALGRAVHRPTFLPTPTFALRMILGEGADMLLTGQRVLPQRTQSEGYAFRFAEIDEALANAVA